MYIFLLTCKNVISGGYHPPVVTFPFNFGLVVLGFSPPPSNKPPGYREIYTPKYFRALINPSTTRPKLNGKLSTGGGWLPPEMAFLQVSMSPKKILLY